MIGFPDPLSVIAVVTDSYRIRRHRAALIAFDPLCGRVVCSLPVPLQGVLWFSHSLYAIAILFVCLSFCPTVCRAKNTVQCQNDWTGVTAYNPSNQKHPLLQQERSSNNRW